MDVSDARERLRGMPGGAILCVVGARPNFMKIAPLMAAFARDPEGTPACLVHTGQHYDEAMNDAFFTQLGIPRPDVDLGVGSSSHAVQTAEIMLRFEPVVDAVRPDAVLVVGDVNSTIACALVAVKRDVPVFHVEAGLRSFDRRMPEEINRILTDQISELLFTTEEDALRNLRREGVDESRVHFVGNVMIDTLIGHRQRAVPSRETLMRLSGREPPPGATSGFGLVTLHRPSNVDDPTTLDGLLAMLEETSRKLPLVFPVHPRTRKAIAGAGLEHRLAAASGILVSEPLGYLETLGLMADARLVMTDSGGMQEETTALGVPCLTLRENTERPITVEQGTNTVVGTDTRLIRETVDRILATGGKAGRVPDRWDGKAALRIRDIIRDWRIARRRA